MTEIQQRIKEALITLLQTNAVHEIGVSQLCNLANISRSVFYANYCDMAALEAAFCQNVEAQLSAELPTADNFTWVFSYISKHPDLFTAYFKLPYLEKKEDYKTIFFRKGFYSVAKMWFEDGCIESPEQMSDIIQREYTKLFQ